MKKALLSLFVLSLVGGIFSGAVYNAAAAQDRYEDRYQDRSQDRYESRAREARIPFVQYGGIRDWRTDRDDSLFIQDGSRRWYRVALMGPCIGLEYASGVRFLPSDSAGTFDRFSWIVAGGQRCKVQSVQQIRGVPDVRNHPHPRS